MSFEVALTGLNAASAELQIIANNIANSNTSGFKQSRGEFADIFASSSLGATANAVGSGVRLSKVAQQFSQGNINFTENNLDLAVNGQGFFRLDDNGSIAYARAGAFSVDRDGNVVNPAGQQLTVFTADASGAVTGAIGPLTLTTNTIAPIATTSTTIDANIDASKPAIPITTLFNAADPSTFSHSTSTTIYDSLGSSHLQTIYLKKIVDNNWDMYMKVDGQEIIPTGGATGDAWRLPFNPADGTINAAGIALYDVSAGTAVGGAPAVPTTTLTYQSFTPSGTPTAMTLGYHVEDLTQFGSPFSVNSLSQNGTPVGRLSGIDIDESGIVFARFSNGESSILGQVVLTNFANPGGLGQGGDSTWTESFDSGAALDGAPGTSSLGLIQSGALEDSNVDLSKQLVTLITAQRNFQANAQVISANNTITQTILNIGR